ncbi:MULTISPECIES: alanine racemase [Vibrio]|uniref:Broad specificity amino-acid racemase n=2 Tax=Vibrio alginolyticus TaxID=663 RepID=A0AA36UTS1_VIBAL|nr:MULTISPECIES: alanine racemase [Vibrio]AGV20185.1 alanine racemase [Vibrio alginolyticus NBRC 15630 = ATCC 17749]AVF68382.1 alanine racemase [Vibrio alginolyticus]EGQ9137462.1 alanine racemase [Vibrio alginolyticus]ELB1087397.1 alanine racemase [Vibrio alginolyticus]ELB1511372.1 alanine racemase [Vibrio alginolyticus]
MRLNKTLLSLTIAAAIAAPVMQATAAPLQISNTAAKAEQVQGANAWLEINLGQFRDNIEQFKSHMDGKTKICAVMKADAYGNGIAGLMPTIIEQQIPCVAVASNAEAQTVRDSGFKGQLMRVRSADIGEIEAAIDLNVEELIGTAEQAKALSKLAEKAGKEIKAHLALNDGGMGRNGVDMTTEAGKKEALKIAQQAGVNIVGIMTHFPNYNADDVRQKLASFKDSSAWLIKEANLKRDNILLHVANSYTALNVPEAQLDMVRPGGVLYGDLPTNPEYPSIVSFKTRVASVHHLPKNSTVGYDSSYTTSKESLMANIPVGYSDGYPRKMGNTAEVLINGQRAKVAGVASMNTTMVDVTGIKDVEPGSEVVLFGSQQGKTISATEMEKHAEVIFPELYTVWGSANPRVYVK